MGSNEGSRFLSAPRKRRRKGRTCEKEWGPEKGVRLGGLGTEGGNLIKDGGMKILCERGHREV